MCTGPETQTCVRIGETAAETCSIGNALKQDKKEGWALRRVTFTANGALGQLVCDTGADVTVVDHKYALKAGLAVNKESSIKKVTAANGRSIDIKGSTNMTIVIQVVLDTGDGILVHWDRAVELKNVLVVDMGEPSRDLFVAYADWAPPTDKRPESPLAALAALVLAGAVVYDTPRIPEHGALQPETVVVAALDGGGGGGEGKEPAPPKAVDKPTAPASVKEIEDFKKKCWDKVAPEYKDTAAARRLVGGLVRRMRLFGPHVTAELTETVDFTLKEGVSPKPVSFKVPLKRGATEAALDGLNKWIEEGVCERVPWTTPAYGFVIIVPKSGGKFRVTVSPKSVNEATEQYDPEGGYMPDSMAHSAHRVGLRNYGYKLDFKEAFTTLKLAPEAQRLSTFTSPLGKVQFKRGWFGYHSFPGLWQTTVMEHVVLPTLDKFKKRPVDLENWVDDLLGGADNAETMVDMLFETLDAIGAIGGRLSIDKCVFMDNKFDYCGITICLKSHTWKLDQDRVKSLLDLPVPVDREALDHLLGVYRYYYFATHDQAGQRQRIAALAELSVPGVRIKDVWKDNHTKIMQECAEAVVNGDFALCFDPSKNLFVTTDASGLHGYCVTAHQWDKNTGKLRPVAFYSKGWIATQLKWTPQVKEAYAVRQAVCVYMPKHFPYARVTVLCDNKNLATDTVSEDHRVARWLHDIMSSGCVRRFWLKGEFNTIADYGSRAVQANPMGRLSEEEEFEMHIYGMTVDTLEGDTVIPGHVKMAPLVAKIVAAQEAASPQEKQTWEGKAFDVIKIGDKTVVVHHGRLVVPKGAHQLKQVLMRAAHDDVAHYTGGERTLWALQVQAKVFWMDMKQEVQAYINSCAECQQVKTRHKAPGGGHLHPTHPLRPHDTWYVDLKGPMPKGVGSTDTGYILLVVEAFSRVVKLRYVPKATAAEVLEELAEVALSFGTTPTVIRSDGGQPFDSSDYKKWCEERGIRPIKGLPGHSRGQGMVETRFKTIADAIMASLGGKAPTNWWQGTLLARLEGIINSTYVESVGGSPWWVLTGFEPRTLLSAMTDKSNVAFGADVLGMPGVSFEIYNNMIAAHHGAINAIQNRAGLATTLASAVTQTTWNKDHAASDFKKGQWVLKHVVAPNRMAPHFTGPYKIVSMDGDGNAARLAHYLSLGTTEGPVHVARMLHFDMSRATPAQLALFQLGEGNGIVEGVQEHRVAADGATDFKIKWLGHPVATWVDGKQVSKVVKVIQYCEVLGLPEPGKTAKAAPKVRFAGGGAKAGTKT